MEALYITLGAIVLLLAVHFLVIGRITFKTGFVPQGDLRQMAPKKDDDAPPLVPEREVDEEWFTRVGMQETTLLTAEGLKLNVGYIRHPSQSRLVAVCLHGRNSFNLRTQHIAEMLYDEGYNIVCMDARAHGRSEGRVTGMGWLERDDNVRLLKLTKELFGEDCRIVIHGVSMGGATVCMLSGEQLPDNVRAIISDCAYTSVYDQMAYVIQGVGGFPFPGLLLSAAAPYCRANGFPLYHASAVEQVKKATVPMLFIHGEEDLFVPYAMMEPLYENCGSAMKECYSVPDAGHGVALEVDPEAYKAHVMDFLDRAGINAD